MEDSSVPGTIPLPEESIVNIVPSSSSSTASSSSSSSFSGLVSSSTSSAAFSEPFNPSVTTTSVTLNPREQRLTHGTWPNVLDLLTDISISPSSTSSNSATDPNGTVLPSSTPPPPSTTNPSSYHLMDRQSILKRIWDTGTINIYACTWNMHGKPVPDDLSALIPRSHRSLLYAFGSEECGAGITASLLSPTGNSGKDKWENRLQTELGSAYVRISSVSMGAIHLVIFAHEAISPIISDVQTGIVPTGIGNTVGNKGGIGIGFNLGKTALLFMNCHFAAHQNAVRRRNEDYQRIEEIMPLVPNGYNTEARIQLQQQLQAQQRELIHQQEIQQQLRTRSHATLTSASTKTSPSPKKSFITLLPIRSSPKMVVESPRSNNPSNVPNTVEPLVEDDEESESDEDGEEEEDDGGEERNTMVVNEEARANTVETMENDKNSGRNEGTKSNVPADATFMCTPDKPKEDSPPLPSSTSATTILSPSLPPSFTSPTMTSDKPVHSRNVSAFQPNNSTIGATTTIPFTAFSTLPSSTSSSPSIPPLVSDRYDRVIWMGDMNYRINGNRAAVDLLLSTNRHEVLLANDQLLRERNAKRIFQGFDEGPLNFRPTYKYDSKSDKYDTGPKRRIPAWTDRILYKTKMDTLLHTGNGNNGSVLVPPIKLLRYISIDNIQTSDHRPVVAVFDIKLRGGHNRGRGSIASIGSSGTASLLGTHTKDTRGDEGINRLGKSNLWKSEIITSSSSSSFTDSTMNETSTKETASVSKANGDLSSSSSFPVPKKSASHPHPKNNKIVPIDANGQPVPYSTISSSGCTIV